MNWSADDVAEVPFAVVTVMSTIPVPAGLVVAICVSDVTVKLVEAAPPNFTALAPVKPLPLTVTAVPPAAVPLAGEMPLTVGGGKSVNRSANEVPDVPLEVVTVTSTVPLPAGLVAVHCVVVAQVTFVAAFAPNFPVVEPDVSKFVPLIMTTVPPACGPFVGLMLVTLGAGR